MGCSASAPRAGSVTFEGSPASLDTLERAFRERAAGWKLPAGLVDRVAARHARWSGSRGCRARPRRRRGRLACARQLTVTVSYVGAPLVLPHTASGAVLLEERAFTYSLADLLAGVHPDRMSGRVRGDRVAIVLAFDL